MRIGVLLALLIVTALGAAWYHDLTPELPPPVASVISSVTGTAAAPPPPPFRISATLLSASQRTAHVQRLDAARKPYGALIAANEGETVDGYRVDRIDNHRVYFKRDGHWFRLDVGADRSEPVATPPPVAAHQKERTGKFIPPPENIEEIRKDTAIYIEKLKEQPDFKRALEERKLQRQQQSQSTP